MGPSDKNSFLATERRTTFQRMLELEKRNKINRLQSTHQIQLTSTRPVIRSQDAMLASGFLPTPMSSVAKLPANPSANSTEKRHIVQANGDVSHACDESDLDSDISSICHSPGWDDLSGKKRKKEKRERERRRKEQLKIDEIVKQDSKLKKKLTKHPPCASARFLNNSLAERSMSDSAVPTMHHTSDSGISLDSGIQPGEDGRRRSRRGSIDLGLKSLMTGIPGPWKSSPTRHPPIDPVSNIPSSFERKASSASVLPENSFIGGLKLRLATEAKFQDTVRHATSSKDESEEANFLAPIPTREPNLNGSDASMAHGSTASSPHEETKHSPGQWVEGLRAGRTAKHTYLPSEDEKDSIFMLRNMRKGRSRHPPTSRYFEMEACGNMTRDTSLTSTRSSNYSNSCFSEEKAYDYSSHSASLASSRHQYMEPTEPSNVSRGRGNGNYVRGQQPPSRDGSFSEPQRELDTSRSPPKDNDFKNMQKSPGISSRETCTSIRDASTPRPRTRGRALDLASDMENMDEKETTHQINPTDLPHRISGQSTSSFTESKSEYCRSQHPYGLEGIRMVAQAAFSRNPVTVYSPTTSGTSSPTESSARVLIQGPVRPKVNRAITTDASSISTSSQTSFSSQFSKAEPILGQKCPSATKLGLCPSSGLEYSSNQEVPNKIQSGILYIRQKFHTRSAADSSEEDSTIDKLSNTSISTASRLHSKNELALDGSPIDAQFDLSRIRKALDSNTPPSTSVSIPFTDEMSGSDGKNIIEKAKQSGMSDTEDLSKTSTGIRRSVANRLSSPLRKQSPPANFSEEVITASPRMQRQKSLSRSVSTPDMSFLPALKHQALIPPSKKKGKCILSKKEKALLSNKEESLEQQSLIRHPFNPLVPAETKSDAPPDSSRYLQNARMNITRPSSRSPIFHSSKDQALTTNGYDPFAKMFVVCCACKYFHDMPSKLYECMAKTDDVVTDSNLGVSGIISTSVKCPWCGHGMSTACCAGYAAIVCIKEKLH